MLRITVTPEQANFMISVPPQYVGKELEMLIFAVEEVTEMPSISGIAAQFKDAPSDEPERL